MTGHVFQLFETRALGVCERLTAAGAREMIPARKHAALNIEAPEPVHLVGERITRPPRPPRPPRRAAALHVGPIQRRHEDIHEQLAERVGAAARSLLLRATLLARLLDRLLDRHAISKPNPAQDRLEAAQVALDALDVARLELRQRFDVIAGDGKIVGMALQPFAQPRRLLDPGAGALRLSGA